MPDVFLSFSTRGTITKEWIAGFREDLQTAFNAIESVLPLEIWDYINEDWVAVDFSKEIDDLLPESTILILVLDPGFMASPQTRTELGNYQKLRTAAGRKINIIKVIKRFGDRGTELNQVLSTNLVQAQFSRTPRFGSETEFDRNSTEYKSEINKIARQTREFLWDDTLEKTAANIRESLAGTTGDNHIFVAVSEPTISQLRIQFIGQLGNGIRNSKSPEVNKIKIFPDNFTGAIRYRYVYELLCTENHYRKDLTTDILSRCGTIVIPFEAATPEITETIYKGLYLQLRSIKQYLQTKPIPLRIWMNIPDIMKTDERILEEIIYPAQTGALNMRLATDNIVAFLETFMVDLERAYYQSPPAAERYIYMVEEVGDSDAETQMTVEQLEQEYQNRLAVRNYILEQQFQLLTDAPEQMELNAVVDARVDYLNLSSGVIIYRGIREKPSWCKNQQANIFQKIKRLGAQQGKPDLERAVYVDKLQPRRDRGDYSFYAYKVILEYPGQLMDFLNRINNA